MSELIKYPFDPNKAGIPLSGIIDQILSGKKMGEVTGGSGRKIRFLGWVPHEFEIYDKADDYWMKSSVQEGVVSFDLRTRDLKELDFAGNRGRHPDMFAKDFIAAALNFFKIRGLSITAWEAIWNSESINYEQFILGLRNGQSATESARQTWTGKLAIQHGFTQIREADIRTIGQTDCISALFLKPR